MRVEMRTQAVRFAALAGLALALAGCDTIRDAAGITKDAPDEFAVVTKAPLVVPPDFNLRPPRPGVAPTNQLSPTDAAQNALFPDDPGAVAATIPGNYSQGEKLLLATAGAANANDSIRQMIAADDKSMEAADDSFTNRVLFGNSAATTDAPLDADAEKARLDRGKPAARASADAGATTSQPVAQLPDDTSGGATDDSGAGTPPDSSDAGTPPDTSSAGAPADSDAGAPPADGGTVGYLPPIDGSQDQPAPKPVHHPKAQKDDSGWLDGIF